LVLNGGTLSSNGNFNTLNAVTLNGGTLTSTTGTSSLAGTVTLGASTTVSIDTGAQLTLSGVVSGAGFGLTKTGAGTLVLSGTNTYDGGTTVSEGSLIGTTTSLQGAITNNAAVTFNQATTGTYAGVMSGTGSLTKSGAGAVTLSGTNTYTGATTVSAGQLVVDGSSSSSAHTVGNGGTLGGSGTVGALVVQSGGTIAPGNSPGILTVNGNTTWLNGGNYNWQLLDATGAAGTGWDKLAITGALDLAGLTAGGFNVNVWSLSTFAGTTGNAQYFDGNGGMYSWIMATADGGITGFDAGDFTIFTAANNGTNGFTNDFTGGTFSMSVEGNNLNLNYLGPNPVPEPASAFTVLALFSSGVLHRRRRVVRR
jgi:autotransporter-associated beta strand protein